MSPAVKVRSRPNLTDKESRLAHGKLLLTALYEPDPLKRGAARRAIALLFSMADYGDG